MGSSSEAIAASLPESKRCFSEGWAPEHFRVFSGQSVCIGLARHLLVGGKRWLAWQNAQIMNLALNIAKYVTEENPMVARQQDVSVFCSDVGKEQDKLARLEKPVAQL